MKIRMIAEGAKSLIAPKVLPRVKTVEENHYLVWQSIGQALYNAMESYEHEQEEKERSTSQ